MTFAAYLSAVVPNVENNGGSARFHEDCHELAARRSDRQHRIMIRPCDAAAHLCAFKGPYATIASRSGLATLRRTFVPSKVQIEYACKNTRHEACRVFLHA